MWSWICDGVGSHALRWTYVCRIDCGMDGDLFIQILDHKLQESLAHYIKFPQDIRLQQDNNLKYTCKGPRNSSQNMDSLFNKILNNHQTLIQLNISGKTSKRGSETMKHHQVGCWSCRREWRLKGIQFLLKCVRI